MLQITKVVKKTVEHPSTQKNVTRECKMTFAAVDPKSDSWLEDAITLCGGDSALAAKVFNFGMYRFLSQNETNQLGKVGETSKNYAKIVAGFTGMGMSVEEAKASILANPVLRAKLESETFEQFTEAKIENFKTYQTGTDDKGAAYDRIQDVTATQDDTPEEAEAAK